MAQTTDLKSKVLITVPDLTRPGGVSALYNILHLNDVDNIAYFEIHGYSGNNKVLRLLDLFLIYIGFFFKTFTYKTIHVNPSMDRKSFIRDGMFVYIAKILNRKVLVYWHGWDDSFEAAIKNSPKLQKFLAQSFSKAELHITLGTVFTNKLKSLGIKGEIKVESNAASDAYMSGLPVKGIDASKTVNLLFIARLEREKGIYIALDAVHQLAANTRFKIELTIAGDGSEMQNAVKYVSDNNIKNIKFEGFVGGEKKHQLLEQADVLFFPTYYNEGMPITLIEGMLYGLPIITRPVGGVTDWVTDKENGLILTSMDGGDYAKAILDILETPGLYKKISDNNIQKAQSFFTPVKVRERFFSYYKKLENAYE